MRGLAILLLLAACRSAPSYHPSPLGHLTMLLGRWHGSFSTRIAGRDEPVRGTAVTDVSWHGSLVFELTQTRVEGFPPSVASGVWIPDGSRYRTWRVDSYGQYSSGTATYDEESSTWHLESRTKNAETGEVTLGEGFMRYLDRDHKVYEWTSRSERTEEIAFEVRGLSRRATGRAPATQP